MIEAIRIENLRSLVDTGMIDLKPLTVLVGSNSSGKSTFLRTFPLLGQTASHLHKSAISWFDDSSVDFGDFTTSKTRGVEADYIRISLQINISDRKRSLIRILGPGSKRSSNDLLTHAKLRLTYKQKADGKDTFISSIDILENQNITKFIFPEKEKEPITIEVNGQAIEDIELKFRRNSIRGIFPVAEIVYSDSTSSSQRYKDILDSLFRPLLEVCSTNFKHTEKLREISTLWNVDRTVFLKNLKRYTKIITLHREFQKWNENDELFLKFYNTLRAMRLLQELMFINVEIGEYFLNCDYIAPLRAEADRYYRYHGLQVERVDAYGRNLAEFIDSLTEKQSLSLNKYIEDILKVKIKVRNNSGHQSIVLLRDKGGEGEEERNERDETNLADVGFGYSQILPIVTKLWHIQQRDRFNSLSFYQSPFAMALIEQPELHLHPALQAKLADVFVKAAINEQASSSILIETHSPVIINRIGRRVREGHISAEKVNVVIFDKSDNDKWSKVHQTTFDEKGRLIDWPYGFFEPDNDVF